MLVRLACDHRKGSSASPIPNYLSLHAPCNALNEGSFIMLLTSCDPGLDGMLSKIVDEVSTIDARCRSIRQRHNHASSLQKKMER